MLLILGICLTVSGCDEFGWNPLDPNYEKVVFANREKPPPLLLEFSVPTLDNAASFYDERFEMETDLYFRRRTWRGPPDADIAASLMEIRRLDNAPIDAAPAPEAAAEYWDMLSRRHLNFQTLYSSRNAIGPVLWRRFTMGPQICVILSQSWQADEAAPVTRTIVGYYCAPSGEEFSDGQAETVVRSVILKEGDPAQSTDGDG